MNEPVCAPASDSRSPPLRAIPRSRLLAVAILTLQTLLLAWSAAVHSPTMDEGFHLASGIRQWQYGRHDIDRGNPPLVGSIAAMPVICANPATDWTRAGSTFHTGSDLIRANGERIFWLMTLARWALVPICAWGGIVCYWWACELWGTRAGLLALTLWCFCPQVLGLGPLVTGDMSATVFGLTTLFVLWKWLRKPNWPVALLCGFVWGLAEVSKFVCLLWYPLCLLIWFIWRWSERKERPCMRTVLRESPQILAMLLISLNVINFSYGYADVGQPLKRYAVGRKLLDIRQIQFARNWLAECPVPLPSDYVKGFGEITEVATSKPTSYLRGEHKTGGWWYYYLYGWGVKLPLGTWCLIVMATAIGVRRLARRKPGPDPRSEWLLVGSATAIFVFVNWTSGLQFLRYTLPALPLVLIWASQVAADDCWDRRGLRYGILASTAWSVISSLAIYPHSLSYFNELAGGPSDGPRHLINDSCDWGQDLLFLRDWVKRHPEARPLKLAYWGFTDPRSAGIEFELPARKSQLIAAARSTNSETPTSASMPLVTPGWYAVSIGMSHGLPWLFVHDGQGNEATTVRGDFDYFQDLPITDRAGYSIRIFHIDEQTAARINQSLIIESRRSMGQAD